MGTNWFIPALVKSKFGEVGIKLAEGTIVWPFPRKNSKNPFLTSADFMELIEDHNLKAASPQARVVREHLSFTFTPAKTFPLFLEALGMNHEPSGHAAC
jgi:hypothetical protein